MSAINSEKQKLNNLLGWDYTTALSEIIDNKFCEIFEDKEIDNDNFVLIAVGGYGRLDMCPSSDIDVLLVHKEDINAQSVATQIWYPIWDEGYTLGYSVGSVNQIEELVRSDFNWATSVLSARHVVGNLALFQDVRNVCYNLWKSEPEVMLNKLYASIKSRQSKYGDSAFLIEPDIKNGRGGLRDVHALQWATNVDPGFAEDYLIELRKDITILLETRVELHKLTSNRTDILTFDLQDEIANSLHDGSASELMLRVATAARRIGWYSDDAWSRWLHKINRSHKKGENFFSTKVAEFEIVDGFLKISDDIDVSKPPCLILKFARIAAELNMEMDRDSLTRLAQNSIDLTNPWNDEAKSDFVELFLAGKSAINAIEDLDHFGLMQFVFPEWQAVRCHPQRNVLHKYTVDRHLCETAVEAGNHVDLVKRPDLLVVGAFLHDIGKGYKGDHTEVGVELIGKIAETMGFDEEDATILVDLCKYHLLLADIATRRDLSDPGSATTVAAAVQNLDFLYLLFALTQADSIATGPLAWGEWKKGLVEELVYRTEHILKYGEFDPSQVQEFPSPSLKKKMARAEQVIWGKDNTFTVIDVEEDNLFGLMAGVLAVAGLQVIRASVASMRVDDQVVRCCQLSVQSRTWGDIVWKEVEELAVKALKGRLAIQARIKVKSEELRQSRKRLSAEPPKKDITFDNVGSDLATIVEIHSLTTNDLLYQMIQSLAELRLEIKHAQVQTFGPQMVSTFYIVDESQKKLFEPEVMNELKLAINQILSESQM